MAFDYEQNKIDRAVAAASGADAVVLTRSREAGSMVGSHDAVFTLSLREPIYVRAYVGERDLGRAERCRTENAPRLNDA